LLDCRRPHTAELKNI